MTPVKQGEVIILAITRHP